MTASMAAINGCQLMDIINGCHSDEIFQPFVFHHNSFQRGKSERGKKIVCVCVCVNEIPTFVVGCLYSVQYKSIFSALTRSDTIRVIRPDHGVRSEVPIPTPHRDMSWQSQHIITTSLPGCRTAFLYRQLVLDRPLSQI